MENKTLLWIGVAVFSAGILYKLFRINKLVKDYTTRK